MSYLNSNVNGGYFNVPLTGNTEVEVLESFCALLTTPTVREFLDRTEKVYSIRTLQIDEKPLVLDEVICDVP